MTSIVPNFSNLISIEVNKKNSEALQQHKPAGQQTDACILTQMV